MRPQFAQAGAHALRVGGQIERPERTDFAVANESSVRLNAHNRAVENGDRLAAGPFVSGLVERKFDAMGEDADDVHAGLMMNSPIILSQPKAWPATAPSRRRAVSI